MVFSLFVCYIVSVTSQLHKVQLFDIPGLQFVIFATVYDQAKIIVIFIHTDFFTNN